MSWKEPSGAWDPGAGGSSPHYRAPHFRLSLSQLPLASLPLPGQWVCRTLAVLERAKRKNTKVVCCPVRDTYLGRYKSLWQTHTWCRGVRSSEGTRKHPYLCCRLRTGSEPGGGRANLGNWSKSRCYISVVCLFFFKPRLCSRLELAISNHPAGPRLPVCRGERGKNSI